MHVPPEAEPHPDPVKESDVNVMQLLAMGNTCPYMPTSFREFLKVAVELGRALKPTNASTNTSMVGDDLASAAATATGLASAFSSNVSSANGEDKDCDALPPTAASTAAVTAAATATSRLCPAGVSGGGAGGGDATGTSPHRQENGHGENGEDEEDDDEDDEEEDEEAEEDDGEGTMPSFAPRERMGVARMSSAPAIVAGGGRKRKGSLSSAGSGGSHSLEEDGDQARGTVGTPNGTEASTDATAAGGVDARSSLFGDFYHSVRKALAIVSVFFVFFHV